MTIPGAHPAPTVLQPQEIFLLQRYISAPYFRDLRDTWAAMIDHLETCLDRHFEKLSGWRRFWQAPHPAAHNWRYRVMPNFRDTLQGLEEACMLLNTGDLSGLAHCNGPLNDLKGQMDSWSGWMMREDENRYGELLSRAVMLAANIQATEGGYWHPGELTVLYDVPARGPLDPPERWPTCRLSANVHVASGSPFTINGIYLPDVPGSCAQFLHLPYGTAPPARVQTGIRTLFAPDTGLAYGEEQIVEDRPCIWTLVETIED